MGIPGFWGYLSNKLSRTKTGEIAISANNDNLQSQHAYDYLFLDFQSLIYATYISFFQEINQFITLIFILKQNVQLQNINKSLEPKEPKIIDILTYIHEKYQDFFLKFSIPTIRSNTNYEYKRTINEIYDKISNQQFANINQHVVNYLAFLVVELVKNLSETHLVENGEKIYNRTYIFFDGIPSIAKIKEQLTRRTFPEISKIVKNEFYEEMGQIRNFLDCLMSESPPPIHKGSPIVDKLRELLNITDPVKGSFFINDDSQYGEAEHQIMKFLNKDDKFINKKLLLASPDGDLILLSFINFAKNIKFDILRITANQDYLLYDKVKLYSYEDADANKKIKSIFKYNFDYIYIEKLCKAFEFYDGTEFLTQKAMDFSYLLLLLGDDFIPAIPTISISAFDTLEETYENIIKQNPEYKIVECNPHTKCTLNFENLFFYFDKLSIKEKEMSEVKRNKCNKKKRFGAIDSLKLFNNYKTMHKLDKLQSADHNKLLSEDDRYFIAEYHLFLNGIYCDDIDEINDPRPRCISLLGCVDPLGIKNPANMIEQYIKGCKFIFDIYINNTVENYKWHYPYDSSPTLKEIVDYYNANKDNIAIIASNSDPNRTEYFNNETYRKYYDMNFQFHMIKLLEKIKKRKWVEFSRDITAEFNKVVDYGKKIMNGENITDEEQRELNNLLSILKPIFFTHWNIRLTFSANKNSFDKSFGPEKLINPKATHFISGIDSATLGGNMPNKYEYKFNKYLEKIKKL